jgi:hypothetical protein
MKCSRCGVDNKKKDRNVNNGRCKKCRRPFTFEPTTMGAVKVTDIFFAKALSELSSHGTLFFNRKQFLYFLDKKLKRKLMSWIRAISSYIYFSFWCTGFLGGMLSMFNLVLLLTILKINTVGQGFYIILPCIIVMTAHNLYCIFFLFQQSRSPQVGAYQRKLNTDLLLGLGIIILLAVGIFGNKLRIAYTILAAIIGLLAISLGIMRRLQLKNIIDEFLVEPNSIKSWLQSWAENNGSIDKLLPEVEANLPQQAIEPSADITNYSFDRLVVCDRPELAQILIANNFHFEHNCAILCVSGYPEPIFEVTMEMLRRNPDLQVFAFHNCDPNGLMLANELTNSTEWFAGTNVKVIDLGLLPRQVLAKSQPLAVRNSPIAVAQEARELIPQIRQNLSPEELAWLDRGNYVELESFTPQQLLIILQLGIHASQQMDLDSSSDLVFVDSGGDGGFYSIDSFG